MNIVADRNIPGLEAYFGDLGDVMQLDGRAIDRASLADADVLLVRSVTRVDAQLLRDTPVRFVGSATSGHDHIARQELAQADIAFAHAHGSNAQSVVEYVLAALCHHRAALEQLLAGAPQGVIGYGRVGRRLVECLEALQIPCRVSDPWLPDEPMAQASLEAVLDCPVISVHSELTREDPWPSYHLLGAQQLSALNPGTLLINASRGPVIDNAALRDRLALRSDIDVVLDVWEGEPAIDLSLMALCSLGTPHIAGYSVDAKLAATAMLRQALGKHLGRNLPVPAHPASAPAPTIELEDGQSTAETLTRLLRARYLIEKDDRRLRDRLAQGADSERGQIFDQLRRDYPARREVAGATVRYRGRDERIQRLLDVLVCERV